MTPDPTQRAMLQQLQEISDSMHAFLDRWPDAKLVQLVDLGDKLSKTSVIDGTRIPVMCLFKALADGQSIGDFLAAHPELAPGKAALLLLRAGRMLEETAL